MTIRHIGFIQLLWQKNETGSLKNVGSVVIHSARCDSCTNSEIIISEKVEHSPEYNPKLPLSKPEV